MPSLGIYFAHLFTNKDNPCSGSVYTQFNGVASLCQLHANGHNNYAYISNNGNMLLEGFPTPEFLSSKLYKKLTSQASQKRSVAKIDSTQTPAKPKMQSNLHLFLPNRDKELRAGINKMIKDRYINVQSSASKKLFEALDTFTRIYRDLDKIPSGKYLIIQANNGLDDKVLITRNKADLYQYKNDDGSLISIYFYEASYQDLAEIYAQVHSEIIPLPEGRVLYMFIGLKNNDNGYDSDKTVKA